MQSDFNQLWSQIELPGRQKTKKDRGDDCMPAWPWRMIVSGATGSGKTRAVLQMITTMLPIDRLMVFAKNVQEEDYQKLEKVWCPTREHERDEEISEVEKHNDKVMEDGKPESCIKVPPVPFTYHFSDNLDNFPTMAEMQQTDWNNTQTLVVIDDMVTEKNQDVIAQFIIACRKVNCSFIYITQSYYDVPSVIRKQKSCAMIFGPVNPRASKVLAEDFKGGYTTDEFSAIIEGATSEKYSFLYIDEMAPIELRYRKGFYDPLTEIKEED